ncbi:MAG: hypothetical protein RLZZ606_426 [Actinomycetota bacterium]|jgi:hypothetical protein
MGMLDRIETKTMKNYQKFLEDQGYTVDILKTPCGNSKTVECRRDHVSVSYQESGARAGVFSFYRCAGEIWANFSMQGQNLGTIHLGKWSVDVWADAATVALFIIQQERD